MTAWRSLSAAADGQTGRRPAILGGADAGVHQLGLAPGQNSQPGTSSGLRTPSASASPRGSEHVPRRRRAAPLPPQPCRSATACRCRHTLSRTPVAPDVSAQEPACCRKAARLRAAAPSKIIRKGVMARRLSISISIHSNRKITIASNARQGAAIGRAGKPGDGGR